MGDALDHWKGSLFESLQAAGILRDFAVDPMATDNQPWTQDDRTVFARLLRVSPSQLLRHSATLQERARYFGEIEHRGDLFLDPDTGVATGKVKAWRKYVKPAELAGFLDDNRVIAVYQHVRARVGPRVDAVVRKVSGGVGALAWASYESGTVAMIFFSKSRSRIHAVADHFRGILGRQADGRVRDGCEGEV